MRICFVADTFPRLSETFVLRQVAGMAARGHEVAVLCRRRGSAADGGEAAVQVRRRWGPLAALDGPTERLSPRSRHKVRQALDPLDAAFLRRFDVVVAHFGYEGVRIARLMGRVPGLPPLVTIYHGHDVATLRHAGSLGLYEELFRRGALHLPVNRTFRDILVCAGAPAERTQVHRMGIDPGEFPHRTRDLAARPLRILSVCRLTEKKGLADAIDALERVARARPDLDWRYVVVGRGELESGLRARAAASPVADRIDFRGAQPHAAVRDLLREAAIFLLPSVTAANGDAEGVPVSLMEAMASGAMTVSTRHSGIPELIEDGVSGFLAPERDPDALADAILRAAECGRPGQIAGNAAAKVARDFDAHRQNDALERHLLALAAGRARAAE